MIVKMKFLSITGPKADIDRVVNTYLSKYEIHLENALTELSTMQNITPYIQINPYKETLKQAEDFTALLPEEKRTTTKRLSLEDAINCVFGHGFDSHRLHFLKGRGYLVLLFSDSIGYSRLYFCC